MADAPGMKSKMMIVESHPKDVEDEPRKKGRTSVYTEVEDEVYPAPLYITVGPQCSGKTTILSTLLQSNVSTCDISIDSQKGVYIALPVEYALHINPLNMTETERALRYQKDLPHAVVNQTVHGSTVQERALHPSQFEMYLVLQRLGNKISASEFRDALNTTIPPQYTIPTQDQRKELIDVVEQTIVRRANRITSPTVDLFVVDAIFKGGGLQSAVSKLQQLATNQPRWPVAWGNTNTRPREFENALQCAENSGRPVYFIIYGSPADCSQETKETSLDNTNPLAFLPIVGRKGLVQRNIDRFCSTGRYINVNAINEAILRTEDLLATAISVANISNITDQNHAGVLPDSRNGYSSIGNNSVGSARRIDTTVRLHAALAKLAGFHMNLVTRTVSRIGKPQSIATSSGNGRRNGYDGNNSGRGRAPNTTASGRQGSHRPPVRNSAWGVNSNGNREVAAVAGRIYNTTRYGTSDEDGRWQQRPRSDNASVFGGGNFQRPYRSERSENRWSYRSENAPGGGSDINQRQYRNESLGTDKDRSQHHKDKDENR